ncbi:hypothetical protein GCM10025868_04930 [Angustibacter aerolatus]|uniref:Glyoxalase-like domain-containing protein n=1 Tax=Angustibacter aerolatus TaxID=1162965 RepID=A0ABQ6JAP2_9ACTN|nr:hypothetical protein GCM10025868_04930 [Angustibacter aerolatus]
MWWAHYRGRLDGAPAFADRLFDPEGLRPALWFQQVPEEKAGKNRLHLDLYPTGRDDAMPYERRAEVVEALVAEPARPRRHAGRHRGGRRPERPRVLRDPARPGGERVLRVVNPVTSG